MCIDIWNKKFFESCSFEREKRRPLVWMLFPSFPFTCMPEVPAWTEVQGENWKHGCFRVKLQKQKVISEINKFSNTSNTITLLNYDITMEIEINLYEQKSTGLKIRKKRCLRANYKDIKLWCKGMHKSCNLIYNYKWFNMFAPLTSLFLPCFHYKTFIFICKFSNDSTVPLIED